MKRKLKIMMAVMAVAMSFQSCAQISENDFVEIPGRDIKMLKTEVTQELYESVMGNSPKSYVGADRPIELISWYDAIYFCNRLSEIKGKNPVYAVDGETDVKKWGYTPHEEEEIEGEITQNTKANGFRLPTIEEWKYAAKGGENYEYAGSNNLDEVGWYDENSNNRTHPVAQKKPNGYGLYDMSGNVLEWVWDSHYYYARYYCGGSYGNGVNRCGVDNRNYHNASNRYSSIGFRLVCITERRAAEIVAEKKAEEERRKKIMSDEIVQSIFVKVPDKNYSIVATEVTQKQYESVMGENPSEHKGDYLPVEQVSWYDAIYFCNKLSEMKGKNPVYAVDGETDVKKWGYTPHEEEEIKGRITQNINASGFRLPTLEEWQYAASGGEDYIYAGSDDLDEVGWYDDNSDDKTHPVAQKKANGYGLYDMSGNVWEWVWDSSSGYYCYYCGGGYGNRDFSCEVGNGNSHGADYRNDDVGFRLVCPSK